MGSVRSAPDFVPNHLEKLLFIGKRVGLVRCSGKALPSRAAVLCQLEYLSVPEFIGTENRKVLAFVNLTKEEHIPSFGIRCTNEVHDGTVVDDSTGSHPH